MNYKITYNPDVKKDVQNAVAWYNKQQKGLGRTFYDELEAHISILKEKAPCFARRYNNIRCLPLRKFPFMIHYRISKKMNLVRIEAVFHTSLNPDN